MDTKYNSAWDTSEHIQQVQNAIQFMLVNLRRRSVVHDQSKMSEPEKPIFDEVSPKLQILEYGSDEYKAALEGMGEALQHHYSVNSHHPEHYENGIDGMSLLDLVEMFADWYAAGKRMNDGSMTNSIDVGSKRFGMSEQLKSIFLNTAVEMGWK